MSAELDPDLPELRLVAQLAGVAPSRLAAALSDPERLPQHITADEFMRVGAGVVRLVPIIAAIKKLTELVVFGTTEPRTEN